MYGVLLGCIQGLPITPHFVLTKIDTGLLVQVGVG